MAFDYADFSQAFPWFFPGAAFVFGALVGSFLNVCIYRIPIDRSVVRPGSHCACGQPIAWYDNIPIFSWLILRGRARCCGRPYSIRYPSIELLTAVLFLCCWLRFAPDSPGKALGGMFFISVLICATFIDLDHMIIPDVFTIGAGVVGVVLSFLVPALHGHHEDFFLLASFRSGCDSLQGLLIGSAMVLWIALLAESVLKKEAMGFGDVKFVGAIGAFCGWQGALFAIFGGALVGTLWFLLASAINLARGKSTTGSIWIEPESVDRAGIETSGAPSFGLHVPFGPMLAIGGLLYFLVFDRWIAAYFAELNALL
jgi:leader peptidase (prepilin peptidase)/N-methyltransferase